MSSTEFQDFAGPEVVASNYVIFLHLLARLYEREWVDADALIEATASTMELMWGSEETPGYVGRLNSEETEPQSSRSSVTSTVIPNWWRSSTCTRATPGAPI